MRWLDESGAEIAEPECGSGSVSYEVRPRADAEPLSDEKPAWLDSDWEEVAVWRPWTEAEEDARGVAEAAEAAPYAVAALASAADASDPVGSLGALGRALSWLVGSSRAVPDDVGIACTALVPPWEAGEDVSAGQLRTHGGGLYRVIQPHTTQAGWKPPATPALWGRVSFDAQGVEEWHDPAGAHDAPNAGDLRSHDGKVWRSLINGNHTEPGTEEGARWWVEVPQG